MTEHKCSVDGCDTPTRRKTSLYCDKHYHRVRRHGSPAAKLCTIPGCEREHMARGFCSRHYHRNWGKERRERQGTMYPQAVVRVAVKGWGVRT